MPKFIAPIFNLNAGEWSRLVSSRSDIKKYSASCLVAENVIPLVQGGVRRRSGTRYVASTKNGVAAVLVPFQYSTEQAYILEFGAEYIRFYKDEGQIVSGGSPVELTTTYAADEIADLRFTQNADTLYIFHQLHPPAKLVRTSHTVWTLSDVEFSDGPWLDMNTEGQSGSPRIQNSANTGSITLTASGTYKNGDSFTPFDSTRDIGRLVRLAGASNGIPKGAGYAQITAVASSTSATATVLGQFQESDTQWRWWLGAFYTDNYPRCGTFAEGRLWLASTPSDPQRVWGSRAGLFEDFGPDGDISGKEGSSGTSAHVAYPGGDMTPFDDNGIDYTIGSDDVNAVLWMKYASNLILGTQGGIFKVTGGDNGVITPSSVNIKLTTGVGSSSVFPVLMDGTLGYASRTAKKVLGLEYSVEADDLTATDLTALSSHVTLPGIVQFSRAQEPHSLVGVVREDGQIAVLTFQSDQEVAAWSRWILGGSFGSGESVVESIACIPSTDLSHDQFWVVVKRTIDGQTARYIEFFEQDFRHDDDEEDIEAAFMVDSGLSLDGAGSADPVTITDITSASPGVVTAAGHGYSNGDHVRIRGVTGMDEINHRAFEVASVTTNTFELNDYAGNNIDTSAWGTYESGGSVRKMTTTITGLDHLEGETVDVVGDGSPQPQKTVTGGEITLSTEAAEVHVGLHYDARVVTVGIDPPTPNGGSMQGVKMRPHSALVRCIDTVGGKAGGYEYNLDPIDMRSPSSFMTGPRLAADFEEMVRLDSTHTYQPKIEVKQDQPLPLTLVGMFVHGSSGDE